MFILLCCFSLQLWADGGPVDSSMIPYSGMSGQLRADSLHGHFLWKLHLQYGWHFFDNLCHKLLFIDLTVRKN